MKKLKTMLFPLFFCFIFLSGLEGRDFTFFAAGDPHYGYRMWSDNEETNKEAIDDMNQLPGTHHPKDPEYIQEPRGVIVPGDLTGSGTLFNWSGYWLGKQYDGFDQDYEVNGNGRLRYPVYEGYGNHDIHSGHIAVLQGIYFRNLSRTTPVNISEEGLHYSWDWDDVHFVNLNIYPGREGDAANSLLFLIKDLQEQVSDSGRPVIIMHHYDYWSDWWTKEEQDEFYQAILPYNILAIFVGHIHWSSHRLWNGIDVFTLPTVKDNAYHVVHVKDNVLSVTERVRGFWAKTWKVNISENKLEVIR